MQRANFHLTPIEASQFGIKLEFDTADINTIVDICTGNSDEILDRYYAANGLMLVKGLQAIREQPQARVELSCLFGPEVENYHQTLTSERFFHDSVAAGWQ